MNYVDHLVTQLSTSTLCIVGAGLSGLAIFRIASKRDLEIEILENKRCGGTMKHGRRRMAVDVAVNAARPHPAFWRLVKTLGWNAFAESNPEAKNVGCSSKEKTQLLGFLSKWVHYACCDPSVHQRRKEIGCSGIPIRESLMRWRSVLQTISQRDDLLCLHWRSLVMNHQSNGRNSRRKWLELILCFNQERVSSITGGMQTLVDALVQQLNTFENVKFTSIRPSASLRLLQNIMFQSVLSSGVPL